MICGEHDSITPPDDVQAMASQITDATMTIISGAGHLSNLEQPEQFNAALEELIARVGGRG